MLGPQCDPIIDGVAVAEGDHHLVLEAWTWSVFSTEI